MVVCRHFLVGSLVALTMPESCVVFYKSFSELMLDQILFTTFRSFYLHVFCCVTLCTFVAEQALSRT